MKLGDWLLIAFAWLVLWAANVITDVLNMRALNARIDCLEHPHGESSIAATRLNGRFVITQPAHRTDCP